MADQNNQSAGEENADFDPFEEQLNRRRILPPAGLIVATILVACGIIAIHSASASIEDAVPVIDKAVQFIISVTLTFLLLIAYLIWFAFSCGMPFWFRAVALSLGIGGLIAVGMNVVPLQNKGSLWPTGFKWRGDPYADQTLKKLDTETTIDGAAQLAYTIEPGIPDTNFHQYLGANRDGVVPVSLATNWSDPETAPQQIWATDKKIGAGWSGFAAANGYAVTLEQRGEQEYTACYSIDSGETVWAHAENARHHSPLGGIGPRSTPTIDPETGYVYSSGGTGILVCLKGDDGALVWRKDMVSEVGSTTNQDLQAVMWGRSASPLIVNDKVIIPGGGAPAEDGKSQPPKFVSLIAYDKESGKELWRGGEEQISYSSPALGTFHEKQTVVIINESSVTGHDVETGHQLWRHERPGQSSGGANTSQPVMLPENRILLTKGYGLGAELIEIQKNDEGFTAVRVWQNQRSLRTKMTSAVIRGEYAYGLSDEVLECLKLGSGKRAWRRGRYGHGQVLLCGDTLLIVSEDGELAIVAAQPEGLKEFGRIRAVIGVTWNVPCLHKFQNQWYLLVRNAEKVACFKMTTNENAVADDAGKANEVALVYSDVD